MKGMGIILIIIISIVVIAVIYITMKSHLSAAQGQAAQLNANLNTVESTQAQNYAAQYGAAPQGTNLQVENGQEVDVAPGVQLQ